MFDENKPLNSPPRKTVKTASAKRRDETQSLINAMCKLYFASGVYTEQDHKFIAVAIVSMAYGANLPIPEDFKGFEEERIMFAKILQKAKRILEDN